MIRANSDVVTDSCVFALTIGRCPCLTCTVKITQVGISEVVYSKSYNMDKEVGIILLQYDFIYLPYMQSAAILSAAGIRLRQFSPVRSQKPYIVTSS